MTWEEVGSFVETPQFPTGVTEKTARNRYQANKPTFDRLILKLSGKVRQQQQQFEDLTKQQYRERIEKLRAKAISVKERALDEALVNDEHLALGVKVAESIENRDFGMARQVVDNSGEVNHNHFVWTAQSRDQLVAQERDMLDSGDLLRALPGDVLEADIVADA